MFNEKCWGPPSDLLRNKSIDTYLWKLGSKPRWQSNQFIRDGLMNNNVFFYEKISFLDFKYFSQFISRKDREFLTCCSMWTLFQNLLGNLLTHLSFSCSRIFQICSWLFGVNPNNLFFHVSAFFKYSAGFAE